MPNNRIVMKDHELLVPFILAPWRRYTFGNIKKLTKNSSDSYVYSVLKKYVKENILIEEHAGNVILYKLLLSNYKAQIYVGFIAEYIAWNTKNLPFDVIKKIIGKLTNTYFTVIITGSYARGKETTDSDLDLVIICDDKQDTKYLMAQIHFTCEMSIPEVHPYIFRTSEFLEMLNNNEGNYGKEISKNNKLKYGASNYFRILNEAILHGFDDKKLY